MSNQAGNAGELKHQNRTGKAPGFASREWLVKPTAKDVARHACEKIVSCAAQAIKARGKFKLVLAGGATPKQVYRLLAAQPCDWPRWRLYLGDERCLPKNHADRNSCMIQQTLLANPAVAIADEQCYFIEGELGPVDAARKYQDIIAKATPFDMVLLGMGDDGHTASLFPGRDYPQDEWVHAVFNAPKPPPERVSLSVKALSRTECLLIIVTGVAKKQAVLRWRQGEDLPVARIGAFNESLVLLDESAWPEEQL